MLFASTAGFCGAQVAWGVQNSIATPTFRELGVNPSNTALIWLAGPISGIMVQPIVGQWSDRCTSQLGRRRPFILASSLLVCTALLVFGNARYLGRVLCNGVGAAEPGAVATAVAVLAFWAMDFAVNALQGPMRALASDAFPSEQQAAANGMFALHAGLGGCIAYGMGSLDLVALSGGLAGTQVQALSTGAALVVAALSAGTLLLTRGRDRAHDLRKPGRGAPPSAGSAGSGPCLGACAAAEAFRALPPLLRTVFAAQFLTSVGKNGSLMLVTDWFGETVYGGDPQAAPGSEALEGFHAGVRAGNLAMLGCGAVSGAFGLALPLLLRRCSKRAVWVAALGVGAAAMGAMALVDRPPGVAFALTAALGVALGARESIPWSVVTAVSKGTPDAGRNTSLFNLSQAVPALVSVCLGSAVLRVASLEATFGVYSVPMLMSMTVVLVAIPADLDAAEAMVGGAAQGPAALEEND